MTVRECAGENVAGDGMGTAEETTVYRNLDQLEKADVLILETKKTIGGRVLRHYRVNWASSGQRPPRASARALRPGFSLEVFATNALTSFAKHPSVHSETRPVYTPIP